jgi:REP element-mobilizing transposase RayT
MGRQWRIEFEGAFYHLLSRGNDGKSIFSDETDRVRFISLLGDLSERFEVNIFAYTLMPNHYHLLLQTRRANLSKAMQWFGTTYTRHYNNKNSCRGHLFQGRYKSILVENDAYLVRLLCYIHRNPLRAGLVKRLIQYRWSSYPVYAYGKDHPEWLQTHLILSQSAAKDPHLAYRRKVQRYAEEKRRIWEDVAHGFIYGSQEFVDWLKSGFLPADPDIEIPQQRKIYKCSPTNRWRLYLISVIQW